MDVWCLFWGAQKRLRCFSNPLSSPVSVRFSMPTCLTGEEIFSVVIRRGLTSTGLFSQRSDRGQQFSAQGYLGGNGQPTAKTTSTPTCWASTHPQPSSTPPRKSRTAILKPKFTELADFEATPARGRRLDRRFCHCGQLRSLPPGLTEERQRLIKDEMGGREGLEWVGEESGRNEEGPGQ